MSSAALSTPVPSAKITLAGRTLREEMDARRAVDGSFGIREALGLLVPVCSQLAELQKGGDKLFVHP